MKQQVKESLNIQCESDFVQERHDTANIYKRQQFKRIEWFHDIFRQIFRLFVYFDEQELDNPIVA